MYYDCSIEEESSFKHYWKVALRNISDNVRLLDSIPPNTAGRGDLEETEID